MHPTSISFLICWQGTYPWYFPWDKGELIYRREYEAMLYHLVRFKRKYSEQVDLHRIIRDKCSSIVSISLPIYTFLLWKKLFFSGLKKNFIYLCLVKKKISS